MATERFAGKAFRLVSEEVVLPSGRVTTRDVVRHPGAVAILPLLLNPLGCVLLHQHRHAIGGSLWEIPAGTRDRADETPAECARRELIEETGYAAGEMRLVKQFYTAPGFCDERMWLYVAWDLVPHAPGAQDEDERIVVHRLPWDQVRAMCDDGRIEDAKTLVALGWLHSVMSDG